MHLNSLRSVRQEGWISPLLTLPEALIEDPESAIGLPGAEVLLDCEARKIFRIHLQVGGVSQRCFLYIFGNRSLGRALRPNYAFHVWRMSARLRQAGFETLDVLAAFRPRRQYLNWRSFMIAREITPVLELPSSGRHRYPVHQAAELGSELLSAVAATLARFHDLGFIHGDLKTRHVLAHLNGASPGATYPWEIVLVDLEKTRWLPGFLGRFHDLLAARDLIQLCASLPDAAAPPGPSAKTELVDRYFELRGLTPHRRRRIQQVIQMYRPGGVFRQGRTLWRSLVDLLGRRQP